MSHNTMEPAISPPAAPASPIFAAPFSNALALAALPCSTVGGDNPDFGCAQVHRLYAAHRDGNGSANGSRSAKGSLSDSYLRCRADKCVEQTRRLTAVSSAPAFMRKDLIIAAEALEDCGITACASEFAMAHSLVCVPLTNPYLAPSLTWLRTSWSPPYVPPELAQAVATALTPASNSSTAPPPPPQPPASLGICTLSLPLNSPCDPDPVNPTSGLPTPPSISRLARTASTSTSPLLPAILGDTLFIPKTPLITGLAAGQLAFPVNFYTPAPCPLGRVLSASPLGSVCTRPAECRLGTCPAPTVGGGSTTACTRDIREPPGAFVADPGTAPLVPDPPSTPALPPVQSTPSSPPATTGGKTGTLFAIASILAPSVLLMVFVMAYMHHRKLERQAYPARQQRVAATRMLSEFPAQRRNREGLPTYSPYPSRPPSYVSVSSSVSSVASVVVAVDHAVELDLADARVPQRKDSADAASLAAEELGAGPSSASLPGPDRL